MPLITPRRRFLIIAPLALLLPAGLLTFLGLETVRGLEKQYGEMANLKVEEIVNQVRNTTSNKVIYTIQEPFKKIFDLEGVKQFKSLPLEDGFSFSLTDSLPAVDMIFVYGSDHKLYFFKRQKIINDSDDDKKSTWILSSDDLTDFSNRIKSAINVNITSLLEAIDKDILPLSQRNFQTLRYPDNIYPLDGRRELAFYTITNIEQPSNKTSWLQAIGITINFEYINSTFFNNMLDEMWLHLQHTIAIEDSLIQQRVAQVIDSSEGTMRESSTFRPTIFHNNYFPWYKLHFSASIGEEYIQIANYHKLFYYSLIAVANIIMIASVIGALRNISKELALSDLRSNFVARVSHELRTPLGLIRLYSETLEMNRAKNEQKRKEYLHAITKESERLTHMINNILNFSRIEANSEHYSFSSASIEPVIMDTVDTMRYHLERNGLSIHVAVDPDLPLVQCDTDALQQALYNLLNNAMKYSGDGKEILVRAYSKKKTVIIDITDYGIGIDPAHQEHIFNEFYRVDDPAVRETGGSGLGLAVVKHIVEAHQGHLSVNSKTGKGSTFSIHLPIINNETDNYDDASS